MSNFYTEDELNNIKKTCYNIAECIPNDFSINNIVNSIDESTEFVLLGECTHGTDEFYKIRAEITKELVIKKGFNMILFEAEWPIFWEVDKYICGRGSNYNSAQDVLNNIKNFPEWMWNNNVIIELVDWLKKCENNVHLFGIDCYSLLRSSKELIEFLKNVDISYGSTIEQKLSFLNNFSTEQQYGNSLVNGEFKNYANSIQQLLQNLLSDIQWNKLPYYKENTDVNDLDLLNAEQNCEILVNADEYYKKLYSEPKGSRASWNIRDQHMATTLMKIKQYYPSSKFIIWAHNSHLGDATAARNGGISFEQNDSWNLGQMVRQIFENVQIFGFYTFNGYVTAAPDWGSVKEHFEINPAFTGSYEYYFHKICVFKNIDKFYIDMDTIKKNKSEITDNYPNLFDEFPFMIRNLNKDNRITISSDINSEIIESSVNIGRNFIVTERIVIKNSITRLKIKDNGWITEYTPFKDTGKDCEVVNSVKEYSAFDFFNNYRLQRWIGVCYHKESELESHYGETRMIQQYNKVIFIDKTNALF